MIWTGFIIGILLGFIIQRGRFCTVALVRESVLRRPIALYMVAIILLIHAVGVYGLATFEYMELEEVYFQPVSAIVGGLIFGVGMMLAGFCPATMWVRTGEGVITAWIALLCFMVGVEFTKAGPLKPIYLAVRELELDQAFVYETLDVSHWWLVVGMAVLLLAWIFRALTKPAPKQFSLPPEHTGIRHLLFEARWHPAATAAMFGLLLVVAWPLAEATGRTVGVAFAGPSGNLLTLLISDKPRLHWGILFVLGVMSGGFLAAKGAGEFRFRVGDAKATLKAAFGGLAMGIGASLASGCIISHCLINSSLLAWQGLVSGLSIIAGASIMAWMLYHKKQKRS